MPTEAEIYAPFMSIFEQCISMQNWYGNPNIYKMFGKNVIVTILCFCFHRHEKDKTINLTKAIEKIIAWSEQCDRGFVIYELLRTIDSALTDSTDTFEYQGKTIFQFVGVPIVVFKEYGLTTGSTQDLTMILRATCLHLAKNPQLCEETLKYINNRFLHCITCGNKDRGNVNPRLNILIEAFVGKFVEGSRSNLDIALSSNNVTYVELMFNMGKNICNHPHYESDIRPALFQLCEQSVDISQLVRAINYSEQGLVGYLVSSGVPVANLMLYHAHKARGKQSSNSAEEGNLYSADAAKAANDNGFVHQELNEEQQPLIAKPAELKKRD